MAITPTANGCRNPKHPTGGTFSGVTYVNYGGAVAIGNGVADDTQAILDALNLGRARGANSALPVAVYLEPGTYNVTKMLQIWDNTYFFGEPSSLPTVVLKTGSAFFQTTD